MKFSTDEYTQAEIKENGNQMYGGKRHDEICDYLQKTYNFNESQINDISMGVWLAINAEREVSKKKIEDLEAAASQGFVGDIQVFLHDLLFENGYGNTFQGIRKLIYSFRKNEGHQPEWGDDSYLVKELSSLKIEDLPNNIFNRNERPGRKL